MIAPLTIKQIEDAFGREFEYKIKEDEERIYFYYRGYATYFGWPTDWSIELLRWNLVDSFRLRNPDSLPPPSNRCYNFVEKGAN